MTRDLFLTFEKYAFRLETLPTYTVESESEDFKYYCATGKIRNNTNNEWINFVQNVVLSGRKVKRLRLVSDELTQYEQFEMQAYTKSIHAGEDVRVARRSDFMELPVDFWLFDDRYVYKMNYDLDGTYLGRELIELKETEKQEYSAWLAVFAKATKI